MEAQSKTLEYYSNLPYTVEVKHDEDGWFAKVVELPGCMTWADTFEELGPMIEDAKHGWIEDALEHDDPVPEPRSTEDFSGKVNLRMPKSLHRDLARRAQEEDVSLNQLMVATLARSVGSHNRPKAAWRIDPGPPGEVPERLQAFTEEFFGELIRLAEESSERARHTVIRNQGPGESTKKPEPR